MALQFRRQDLAVLVETMKKISLLAVLLVLLPHLVPATRIKDIATIDGVRDNQLSDMVWWWV